MDAYRVLFELEDGRGCSLGMRRLGRLSYTQLVTAIVTAYRRKFHVQAADSKWEA